MWDDLQQHYVQVPFQSARSFLDADVFDSYVDYAITNTTENGRPHWWLTANPKGIYTRVVVREVTHEEAKSLTNAWPDEWHDH